jgi:hypothetical protein
VRDVTPVTTSPFIPAVAISSDRTLTEQALRSLAEAINRAGPNCEKIRNLLASGKSVGGASFESTGELRQSAQ